MLTPNGNYLLSEKTTRFATKCYAYLWFAGGFLYGFGFYFFLDILHESGVFQ